MDSNIGTFKVIIERPSNDTSRPKTSGTDGVPNLDVSIPSYRIGTPRFSIRGTPFIRGSSYAGTDAELRPSSYLSRQETEELLSRASRISRRSTQPAIPTARHSYATSHPGNRESTYEIKLPPVAAPPRHTLELIGSKPITPGMYDELSFLPECEDRNVIRRMPGTGLITAATPARLIAEVTQELSYELVASFFITYRAYLSEANLLSLIMARLQWGINRLNEGLIVTVRCFTVIRHWLINFFVDDFVLNYDLRVQFCDITNDMVQHQALKRTNSKTTNDILSSIKRLWRDCCAVYWDGPAFEEGLGPLVPIQPGGIAGSRNPNLTPKFWDEMLASLGKNVIITDKIPDEPPTLDLDLSNSSPSGSSKFFATLPLEHPEEFDRVKQQQVVDSLNHQQQSSYPEPMSPRSVTSVEALSCSFPKPSHKPQLLQKSANPAHPVPVPVSLGTAVPIASIPAAVRPRSNPPPRPLQRHRSTSNSSRPDRTRDSSGSINAASREQLIFVKNEAGGLIRGLLYPPGQPYLPVTESVESRPNSLPSKKGTVSKSENASHHSVKKMFGSVKRAVGTSRGETRVDAGPMKQANRETTHGRRDSIEEFLAGLPVGTGIETGMGRQVLMRPDKLSIIVQRDFEEVVRRHREEVARGEKDGGDEVAHERDGLSPHSDEKSGFDAALPGLLSVSEEDGFQVRQSTSFLLDIPGGPVRHPNDAEMMSGGLQHLSAASFGEEYMERSSAPTPPLTPPERFQGSPRRSSHLLGQDTRRRSSSLDRVPSLIYEMTSPPDDLENVPTFKPIRPRGNSFKGNSFKFPARQASLRKISSFHSGYTHTRNGTERSFDATTFSGSGERERESVSSTHAPGNRVLRRRPGGDLRNVETVGSLERHASLDTFSTFSRDSYRAGEEQVVTDSLSEVEEAAIEDDSRGFSVGALADPDAGKRPLSLLSTSSKPVMRPSFQAEAAKLAQIPDDEDDDGGVESALLKLEGKYEKRKSNISKKASNEVLGKVTPLLLDVDEFGGVAGQSLDEELKAAHRHQHVVVDETELDSGLDDLDVLVADDVTPTLEDPAEWQLQPTVYQPPGVGHERTLSQATDNSIPLLSRDPGLAPTHRQSRTWGHTSILRSPSEERENIQFHNTHVRNFSKPSVEYFPAVDSPSQPPTSAHGTTGAQSFLNLDDDSNTQDGLSEDGSDLSSELSADMTPLGNLPTTISPTSFVPPQLIDEITTPNSAQTMDFHEALTIPVTRQAIGALPPTPDGTPQHAQGEKDFANRSWYGDDHLDTSHKTALKHTISAPHPAGPNVLDEHRPFILSFPSHVLAEQMTLIEKECLLEIHFRELLDIKWAAESASASPNLSGAQGPRSWPRFLSSLKDLESDGGGGRGIEICGARSSVVTSWAVSEVVLTKQIQERAEAIGKFIRIAERCRRLGNYATLFQLTVAMTSPIISELAVTWSRVPDVDRQALRELEALISPANNFSRLREEMEGRLARGEPVVPLVAIYAKDLAALKDMPGYIAGAGGGLLMNVSKCRAQAGVVQVMSRYLEAVEGLDERLGIREVRGVVERCLWVGGLGGGVREEVGDLI
jgi:hypothetical protein